MVPTYLIVLRASQHILSMWNIYFYGNNILGGSPAPSMHQKFTLINLFIIHILDFFLLALFSIRPDGANFAFSHISCVIFTSACEHFYMCCRLLLEGRVGYSQSVVWLKAFPPPPAPAREREINANFVLLSEVFPDRFGVAAACQVWSLNYSDGIDFLLFLFVSSTSLKLSWARTHVMSRVVGAGTKRYMF